MLPITVHPLEIVYTPTRYRLKARQTQKMPYDLPLPYGLRDRMVLLRTGTYSTWTSAQNVYDETLPECSVPTTVSRNVAYAKFVNELGETSSLGATLTAERRETFGMITSGVMTLLKSAREAKRGNVLGLLRLLKFSPPEKIIHKTRKISGKRRRFSERVLVMPDGKRVAKRAANGWLLWSYGVKPLLSDVQNSTDVFIRDLPHQLKVKVTKKVLIDSFTVLRDSSDLKQYRTTKGSVRTGLSATVTVTNPNLWLANQLGLVNPVQWVNEAIPFSFVVDWASNWSQVISSLTDFAGLDISNQCVSTKWVLDVTLTDYAKQLDSTWTSSVLVTNSVLYRRRLESLPKPTLLFKYERFEWPRALNAISLLVGFLPKGK